MNNVLPVATKTLSLAGLIFVIGYISGCVVTPFITVLYAVVTAQPHAAIGSVMGFLLAAISPLGWVVYIIPGFISTLITALIASLLHHRSRWIVFAGAGAPASFYWWFSAIPSLESVFEFMIVPICISSWIAFSVSAAIARRIVRDHNT